VSLACGVLVALGLLYMAARQTGLFALREVEVTGAPRSVREAVRAAAEPYIGQSLVGLDTDELRRELEALPTVRTLRLDRAFPHTLRLVVTAEVPLAVVRDGPRAWLVSRRGRVLRHLDSGDTGTWPRIRADAVTELVPGGMLEDEGAMLALAVLRHLPAHFPVPVKSVRVEDRLATLVLAGGLKLLLGEARATSLKLEVAVRIVRRLPAPKRSELAYLDVSVPERPVGGTAAAWSEATLKSQPEG
jgi:cell division protein FtsQ